MQDAVHAPLGLPVQVGGECGWFGAVCMVCCCGDGIRLRATHHAGVAWVCGGMVKAVGLARPGPIVSFVSDWRLCGDRAGGGWEGDWC